MRIRIELNPKMVALAETETIGPEYICPHVGCGTKRVRTERRKDGYGWCENDHQFKASEFVEQMLPLPKPVDDAFVASPESFT